MSSPAFQIFGLSGRDHTARQALTRRLVTLLTRRGLRVSVAMETTSGFDLDRPGKDSYEHRQAGAAEVMISSAKRWALMHERSERPTPGLDDLMARLTPVDLLLIDGFEDHDHARLEVGRRRPCVDPRVVAIALGQGEVCAGASGEPVPLFDLTDGKAIADFIVAYCGL